MGGTLTLFYEANNNKLHRTPPRTALALHIQGNDTTGGHAAARLELFARRRRASMGLMFAIWGDFRESVRDWGESDVGREGEGGGQGEDPERGSVVEGGRRWRVDGGEAGGGRSWRWRREDRYG
ncbi:hypothetical protein RHGRI_034775 [Rhododendron griersonianum]|uniref:Uncharacterized protein n=1 Tax=Rhododendron griersonianum TaxID=479676 RepID=A0AAV6I2D3_9ERIC|nr:hypothetical protein RHGRI_034775 [Rhododendron griersonianum]